MTTELPLTNNQNYKAVPRPVVLSSEMVGQRVFITAGRYLSEGEGIIEADRGADTLRMLEVRMVDRKVQVVSIDKVQLIDGQSL